MSAPSKAALPNSLLLPFHEIRLVRWDESAGTGRVEATRVNRLDDWYYDCHFKGDPVMPGCWGLDAVWQCLRWFAAERGLPDCKPLGMEDVKFYGQIRPLDGKVTYAVDVVSVEESEGERLITGRAEVSVDGTPVYTIGGAQVGTAFWEAPEKAAMPGPGPDSASHPISREQFLARKSFSYPEIIAISQGSLVTPQGAEQGLLPSGLMLEVGRVPKISAEPATGEGRVLSVRENLPNGWFFPMNGGVKPAALSVDGVWQLMGLFMSWRGRLGTGRALGFERAELYGEITPKDKEILYDLKVTRESEAGETGDSFLRADGMVYADGRPILSMTNANVGCHKGIRYTEYPHDVPMGRGGKVQTR